ncbi:hypothetical protein EsH8_VI_001098 [Colletotrichum jinshuiense]
MSVELALAIPPTVDLCLTYGKKLRRLCSLIKNADATVSESLLRLENGILRFEHQFHFLRRIEHLMKPEHRAVHERTTHVLLTKMEIVASMLNGFLKQRTSDRSDADVAHGHATKRVKVAFKKNSLDEAVEELETWQKAADPSWFLLMRIADSAIDDSLVMSENNSSNSSTSALFPSTLAIRSTLPKRDDSVSVPQKRATGLSLDSAELAKMEIWAIPFCEALVATRINSAGESTRFILNNVTCPPTVNQQAIQADVRDLARRLQHNDPETFGLLTCKGFVKELGVPGSAQATRLTLLFRSPYGSSPRSLRSWLLACSTPNSLTFRLDLAKQLARSVSYVHTFGFVHKNIWPESLLCFDRLVSGTSHTSAFLVGFENFRRDQGNTQRLGDVTPARNLYRHPLRQGASPEAEYTMQHDIYSLGVILLELGLWESFIQSDGGILPLLGIPDSVQGDATKFLAHLQSHAKDHLLALARSLLPHKMGIRYTKVVETCLTCLDPGNCDFGDQSEFEDEDGILVGTRYIEKVILRLDVLCM